MCNSKRLEHEDKKTRKSSISIGLKHESHDWIVSVVSSSIKPFAYLLFSPFLSFTFCNIQLLIYSLHVSCHIIKTGQETEDKFAITACSTRSPHNSYVASLRSYILCPKRQQRQREGWDKILPSPLWRSKSWPTLAGCCTVWIAIIFKDWPHVWNS